jgi:hypothetical protein
LLLLLPAILARPALAGPVDVFGFGADSMGRAGSGVALAASPSGVFANPAGMARMPRSELMLGYSLQRGDFADLPGLRWDTNQDGLISDSDAPLRLDSDPLPADGLSFALGRPVGKRFGVALAGFVPTRGLLRIHTFEPSLPTWFLYENRLQRYELILGFGWEQLPGVHIGGAVELITRARYQLTATMDAKVRGAQEGDSDAGQLIGPIVFDAHEMVIDLVPSYAPIVALHWDVGEAIPPLEGLELGGTWRGAVGLPVDVQVDLQANIDVQDVGDLDPLTIPVVAPFHLSVYDHYVPSRLALGVGYVHPGGRGQVGLDLVRTAWQEMQLNVAHTVSAEVQTPLVQIAEGTIEDGNALSVELRPVWSIRGGGEWWLPPLSTDGRWGTLRLGLRGGGGLEPSPLVSQTSQSSLLDADRFLVAGGLGLQHADPFGIVGGPVNWDAFAQLHRYAEGELQVGGGADRPGRPVGDVPIPIGGHLLAAGMQWSFEY